MKITRVIWLEQFVRKIEQKHRVNPDEVEQALANSPLIQFAQRGTVRGEDLYRAIGQTDAGRYLTVFFIQKNGRALVISARTATRQERKRYG